MHTHVDVAQVGAKKGKIRVFLFFDAWNNTVACLILTILYTAIFKSKNRIPLCGFNICVLYLLARFTNNVEGNHTKDKMYSSPKKAWLDLYFWTSALLFCYNGAELKVAINKLLQSHMAYKNSAQNLREICVFMEVA